MGYQRPYLVLGSCRDSLAAWAGTARCGRFPLVLHWKGFGYRSPTQSRKLWTKTGRVVLAQINRSLCPNLTTSAVVSKENAKRAAKVIHTDAIESVDGSRVADHRTVQTIALQVGSHTE